MSPRGPARAPLALKPGEFLLLAVLQKAPSHGYAIAQAVAARTEGRVQIRPGNLYRVLQRMEQRGLVEPAHRRPAKGADPRRAGVRITQEGRRALLAEARLLDRVAREVLG